MLPVLAIVAIAAVGVVLAGLAVGYRPVVIQTGSMGDTAPPRSLIIAAPTDAEAIITGDIVVMRRPGATPVTHRVIEIETNGSARFAITQGDANEAPDAAPYPLQGRQLVSRWIVPGLGGLLQSIFQPGIVLIILAMATVSVVVQTLRRIWANDEEAVAAEAVPADEPSPSAGMTRRRRRLVLIAAPLAGVLTAGVAAALYRSTEAVATNDFSTADCFDPQLTSVQSGETIHAVDGTVAVPITAVDPTGAFVFASARSSSNEPADSTVRTALTGGGTSLELVRATDGGVPGPVTVAWSIVEYGCGVDVQRGTVNGNGTDQVDVTIAAVDPSAAFVVVSSAAQASATDFGGDDLFIAELTSPTTLTVRTAGGVFSPQRSFAWQIVSFTDPGDIDVQTVSGTLGSGVVSDNLSLATPADPATTFLITTVASAGAGPDIGERLVRTHLVDADTVAVGRAVGGDAIDVQIQVVTLRDGSTVRHGTIDFASTQAARTVTIEPVEVSRSTAMATVAVPGLSAGGWTDHVADDVVGEASATFDLTDNETLSIQREAVASNASFGWQVIEWAGPQWWNPDYGFRQRIDVDTTTAAAPGGYTVPLTFDHASLVASGLSAANGADIRIVRWDGSAWTELDRVLDDVGSWNDSATTIWFRTVTPIAADSTSTYWLYFGNDSPAPAADDPEAVYLLTEDFESGTLGDFEDRTAGTGWYGAAPWTRRLPITVPAATVAADLGDFPLLVSLSNADLGANAQPDGSDIRFTAADGITRLVHEIESWNPGTGTLVAWVRIPTLAASSGTTIHLYYGAADAPAHEDIDATWPDAVEAVWHLDRDPAGTAPQVDDASARNHDGLSGGGMVNGDLVPGLIGGAIDFDGVDDRFQVDSFDLAGATALTLSGWVNLDGYTNDARILTKADDTLNRIFELAVRNDGAARARLSLSGSTVELEAGAGAVTLGAWHHVAATWDGALVRIFVDGVERGSSAASGIIDADPSMPVTIGNLITLDRPVDGRLDEVRIERVARSAAWLAAVEANQRTPTGFVSVGGVQTGSWFAQGTWAARKPLTVDADQVPADLTDFPLLVQFTDPELQAGASPDGADLVFTAADGTTRLDHVIETYNSASGSLSAWVSVPSLSSIGDTNLYLYYANPSAVDQQDPVAVFGPDADLALLGTS